MSIILLSIGISTDPTILPRLFWKAVLVIVVLLIMFNAYLKLRKRRKMSNGPETEQPKEE